MLNNTCTTHKEAKKQTSGFSKWSVQSSFNSSRNFLKPANSSSCQFITWIPQSWQIHNQILRNKRISSTAGQSSSQNRIDKQKDFIQWLFIKLHLRSFIYSIWYQQITHLHKLHVCMHIQSTACNIHNIDKLILHIFSTWYWPFSQYLWLNWHPLKSFHLNISG